jgi:hypothetical protein
MPDFTAADLAYIRRDYLDLETACAQRGIAIDDARALIAARVLPRPAYVLEDGTEMVAPDYFALLDEAGAPDRVRAGFEERYRAAGGDPGTLDEEWDDYLSGVYAVCLKRVSPETIVRKTALVESLTALLERPRPDDVAWRHKLREQVAELDALEREFSPDYDRSDRFGQPPTRDRLIAAARERYPAAFPTG